MAEELVVGHMKLNGFDDACRTGDGADSGIDVIASDAAARVNHDLTPVDVPEVQRFRGAAHRIEHARFYSASGFTAAAVTFAERHEVALFAWDEQLSVAAVSTPQSGADFSAVYARGKALAVRLAPMQTSIAEIKSTIRLVQQSLIALRDGQSVHGVPVASAESADKHGMDALVASREFVALSTNIAETLESLQAELVAKIGAAREVGDLTRAEAAMSLTEERAAAIEQLYAEESRPIAKRLNEAATALGLFGPNADA
jgi:hypothetical protein